jgi:hypothetical protein
MIKHLPTIVTCACAMLVLASRLAAAEPKPLVVVVAKGSAVTDLKREDLKHLFLGGPITSRGNKPLVPFNAAPNSSERVTFDLAIFGRTAAEVGRFWVDRKIRGQGSAPRSLPSSLHIAKVVAKFPNAIGYVPADQLTSQLQPVKLDGIAYTDPRYPIVLPAAAVPSSTSGR